MNLINITKSQYLLLKNIKDGVLAPVHKLINEQELSEILEYTLYKGKTYSLPYLFFIADYITAGTTVSCIYDGMAVASIQIESVYKIDPEAICKNMFETTDRRHPGVDAIFVDSNKYCVAGTIKMVAPNKLNIPYMKVPEVSGTVFQSRNPPHKAHEAIVQKYSPGLLYTTPYSTVNKNDYPFSMKITAYEVIAEKYGTKLYVSTLPRVFAGPREALQNCLIFQNMGASRIIMGRGKNCVDDFYKEDASYKLCKQMYDDGRITIEPIWEETIYSKEGKEIKASHIKRDYIDKGAIPPEHLMSTYISEVLHG